MVSEANFTTDVAMDESRFVLYNNYSDELTQKITFNEIYLQGWVIIEVNFVTNTVMYDSTRELWITIKWIIT
jgi:hypothetical protein